MPDNFSWQRVKDIFQRALDVPPESRADSVEALCAGDETIKAEVLRLLAEWEKAGSFLERPVVSAPSHSAFEPEQMVAGRFRILRQIGAGGMGEVYEAEDTGIGERVAIKTIRPEAADDPQTLARFRREIALARRVNHPNVCRVYDLQPYPAGDGSDSGQGFLLTMELLEGETVAERLKREGPMPVEEVARLAEQLLQGVAAAHEQGVLHRDLKPANLMLVGPRGCERLVILDFGLARMEQRGGEASLGLTESRLFLGTPGYMAPELVEGVAPGRASDLYAVGVTLFEMLAGRRPAQAESPSGRGLTSRQAMAIWGNALGRCISPNPTDRPVSAANVLEALHREAQGRRVRRTLSQAAIPAMILALLVALFFVLSRYIPVKPFWATGKVLMMTPLENRTSDPTLDAVDVLMRAELGQSPEFTMWSPGRLAAVKSRMTPTQREKLEPGKPMDAASWRGVALMEHAPAVVFATLSKVSDDYLLDVRLEQVGDSPERPLKSWPFGAHTSREGIAGAVREVGLQVRKQMGETDLLRQANDRGLAEVTTGSWEALTWYSRAEQPGLPADDAISFYRQAIAKDPAFAMAHMKLGDKLVAMRRWSEGMPEWDEANRLAKSQRLSTHEDLRFRSLYSIETGNFEDARDTLKAWHISFPQDTVVLYYLSDVWRFLGDYDNALKTANELRTQDTAGFLGPVAQAGSLIFLSRWKETAEPVAALRQRGFVELANRYEGIAAMGQQDYVRAEEDFQKMGPSSVFFLSNSLAERGELSRAVAVLEQDRSSDRSVEAKAERAARLLHAAFLELQRGERVRARSLVLESLNEDRSPAGILYAGTILARLGDGGEASEQLTHLSPSLKGKRFDAIRSRVEGEVLLASHRYSEALETLRQAAKAEAASLPKDYLARAYLMAGEKELAKKMLDGILQSPGAVLSNAEPLLPGTLRICREMRERSTSEQPAQKSATRGSTGPR